MKFVTDNVSIQIYYVHLFYESQVHLINLAFLNLKILKAKCVFMPIVKTARVKHSL